MLRVENLGYRHAHAPDPALTGLNLELAAGSALLVGGPSGSGKSTLLAILAGLMPHYFQGELSGGVFLDGRQPERSSLADWGFQVGLMLQNPEAQFLAPTVAEELFLTLRCRAVPPNEARERVEKQLRRFGLEEHREHSVFDLSEGQKQKVILAALTALKPKLLLLDEPSANLDPVSVAELARLLKELKTEGLSLVIADHRLHWLEGLCDQALILDQGRPAFQGSWAELRDTERRQDLGLRSVEPPPALELPRAAAPETVAPETAIHLTTLGFAYPGGPDLFTNLSAALPYGRVSILTGPSGQGKTTLARLLCGLEKPTAGRITYARPGEAGQVVLQNADHQLYMSSVLTEVNLALGLSGRKAKTDGRGLALLGEFGLAGLAERHPQSLSGGEKQRLVVAVGVAAPLNLLVLDEPTSGLDGRNLALVAGQIRAAAERGLAVLVITHDLELAHQCGDQQLFLQ